MIGVLRIIWHDTFTYAALSAIRRRVAARRLHRIVMERRNSFEVQDFTRRRTAMLKHTRKGKSCQA